MFNLLSSGRLDEAPSACWVCLATINDGRRPFTSPSRADKKDTRWCCNLRKLSLNVFLKLFILLSNSFISRSMRAVIVAKFSWMLAQMSILSPTCVRRASPSVLLGALLLEETWSMFDAPALGFSTRLISCISPNWLGSCIECISGLTSEPCLL